MTEAELILQKALVGSNLDSSQWNQIQAGFRNRAFFSSRIAEVNILAAMRGDFELIPSMWRKPDRVAQKKGCDVLELDAFDGILRLVVDPNVGIVSFYKMKRPGGA